MPRVWVGVALVCVVKSPRRGRGPIDHVPCWLSLRCSEDSWKAVLSRRSRCVLVWKMGDEDSSLSSALNFIRPENLRGE